MANARTLLQVILAMAAAYHVLLGIVGIFFKSHAEQLAQSLFRFNLQITPQVQWMLNPFAAYMLAFGLMLGVTASDPIRFRPLIFVAVALFGLRVVQRVFFFATADDALKSVVEPGQNVLHLGVVAAIGIAMCLLALRVRPSEA